MAFKNKKNKKNKKSYIVHATTWKVSKQLVLLWPPLTYTFLLVFVLRFCFLSVTFDYASAAAVVAVAVVFVFCCFCCFCFCFSSFWSVLSVFMSLSNFLSPFPPAQRPVWVFLSLKLSTESLWTKVFSSGKWTVAVLERPDWAWFPGSL